MPVISKQPQIDIMNINSIFKQFEEFITCAT